MPWLLKGLFVLVKTRRGRKLLLTVGLGAVQVAQSDQARKLYERARTRVGDPTLRQKASRRARKDVQTIRR
jgi:hypothetical protein